MWLLSVVVAAVLTRPRKTLLVVVEVQALTLKNVSTSPQEPLA